MYLWHEPLHITNYGKVMIYTVNTLVWKHSDLYQPYKEYGYF